MWLVRKSRQRFDKPMETGTKMRAAFKNALKYAVLAPLRKIVRLRPVWRVLPYVVEPHELVTGPLTYNQDGLASCHNCDFMRDQLFLESYDLGKSTGSWGNASVHWRAYVACWAANKAKVLEGDFVECGVNKGGLARTVIHYVNFPKLNKKFYLLDTFQGLSEKYISKEEKGRGIKPGGYEECYDAVKQTFKAFNVEIIKGTVPDTLPQVKADKVSYLSIDMNCAAPGIAAAEAFWDQMADGEVIMVDDYGWTDHYEQKLAF